MWKFCDKGQIVWISKDYWYLKKNGYPELRDSVLFFVREDACFWDHWNLSFDMHSDLGPVSCFHLCAVLRAHHGEWLQSDGGCRAGVLSFLTSLRAHQLTIHGGSNCWWFWHSLFADSAGNMPLLKASLVTMNMFLWLEKQSQPCPCCSILCQWDSRLKWPSWDWNFLFFENDQYYLLQWWTYFF